MKNWNLTDDVWLRRLFFALALLYIFPFWTVRYLPTIDGACHTYNAWILRQSGNVEEYPLFHQYYEVNWQPYPNWVSQGTMALLMFVVPPLVAEKLLVSGCILLFLGGAWYLVGAVKPGERWLAFLAFPFAYHQLFQNGFYNFSISLGLFLFILGCWWRNRASPTLAFAVKINLLLWACYFSHILSFTLALAAIGILWLATLRRESWRRHALHIPILLPQLVLTLWFFLKQGGGAVAGDLPLQRLLKYFIHLRVLETFSEVQRWGGKALATLFLVLLVYTLRRSGRPLRDEANAFLLLAAAGVLLFIFSPTEMSGGGLIKQRLSLYPYLLLIPWFAPGWAERGKRIGIAALALAALVNLLALAHWYRLRGGEVESYLTALSAVRPNSRVLAVLFQRTWPTDALSHAVGYAALEKGLIDWDNYEAKMPFFPTRFHPSVQHPQLGRIMQEPASLRVLTNRDLIDSVYTWQMPPDSSLRRRLRRSYRRIAHQFGGELWQRKNRQPRIRIPKWQAKRAGSPSSAAPIGESASKSAVSSRREATR
jgi:hypothetical protein